VGAEPWWSLRRGGLIFFSYCKMFVVHHVRRTVIF
jgi:hypothetical protein